MSRVHVIDGVDVTDTVEFGTLTDLTTAARGGERGGGKVIVTDPTGELDLHGWHSYTCDETLCIGRPRLFTGRIGGKEIKRGPEGPIGPGRVWECTLEDVNVLAHQRPTYGTGGKRPAEMGLTRVAWLLTTAAVGGSFIDTGYVVDTFDREFDPADYRTNYPDEILDDIVGIRGRDWFIFWDYAAEAVALFYSFRDHVILTSSLKISNVPGDADYSTVFPTGSAAAGDDASISRQHDDTYSGVLMVTAVGNFFVGDRASTVDTFFHDAPHSRVAIVDNSRIGKESTARAMGEQFLDAHATEKDTLTIPVRLPARLVNYIAAGERVYVKLEHEPGYEDDYVPIRVATRSVSEAGLGEDNEPQYDLVLTCTNSAPANNSGGGAPPTGVFPKPPAPTSTHWYEGEMVFINAFGGGGGMGYAALSGAGGTDTTIYSTNTDGAFFDPDTTYTIHLEITGTNPVDLFGMGWALDAVEVYPPGGAIIGVGGGAPNGANYTLDTTFTTGLSIPPGSLAHMAVKAQGAAFPPQNVTVYWWIDPDGWVVPVDEPPLPGQWVYGEVVAMTGDAGTTDFAYAAGSLRVRVDGVLISPASYTETDPATGAFTLGWVPDADETVTLDYQGI